MKNSLQSKIEAATQADSPLSDAEKRSVFLELRTALESGEVRSAECVNGI
ncbi:MAG TPA: hypothetical protein PLM07_11530 [Candidatus Rifleibacterium sp.]|nr:hypothetical protein [Candidatus Rifleibacterium sp.]HPT46521.1 hypothetical protein [Candidatus Rifleibacterium sp.]